MKLSYTTSSQAASTLAEVLAASAILAVCSAGLMAALANGFSTMRLARDNQRATQILIEQTDLVRLYNWDQVTTPGFIPTTLPPIPYDPQQNNGGGLYYTGTVAISSVPFSANYATNMRQMTLTLKWSTKNILRTRSLTTLIAKDGLQNYVY